MNKFEEEQPRKEEKMLDILRSADKAGRKTTFGPTDYRSMIKSYEDLMEYRAIGKLEECRKIKNKRWIPVEEEKPENGQCVLVVLGNMEPDVGLYEVDELGNGAFYPYVLKDQKRPYVDYNIFVIAWMPIPEYKEEKI